MPKERGMVFPYTKQGMEEAQKYKNALSPEQEVLKKALETSIAGQIQAIQGGIYRIQKQNMMRKILGGGQAGAMRGGMSTGVASDLAWRPKSDAQGNIIPSKAIPLGSYKKGGKVKKKY